MHGSGQSSADRVTAGGHFARHIDELFASPDCKRLGADRRDAILELSRRPEVTVAEIVALLESDPLIAGRTLRIVRSPIYAGRSSIRSLRQAVIRLGLNTMRDIVLEDAMNMRVFRSEPHSAWMEQVRRHSVLTGHCARHVAKTTQACGEYAFLCGLLHDIGMAAILIAAAEHPASASRDDILRATGSRRASASFAGSGRCSEITRVVKDHRRRDGRRRVCRDGLCRLPRRGARQPGGRPRASRTGCGHRPERRSGARHSPRTPRHHQRDVVRDGAVRGAAPRSGRVRGRERRLIGASAAQAASGPRRP